MQEKVLLQALREIGYHLVGTKKTRKNADQSFAGAAICYLQKELRLEMPELTASQFSLALNQRLLVLGRIRKHHKPHDGLAFMLKAYGLDGAEQLLHASVAGKKTVH